MDKGQLSIQSFGGAIAAAWVAVQCSAEAQNRTAVHWNLPCSSQTAAAAALLCTVLAVSLATLAEAAQSHTLAGLFNARQGKSDTAIESSKQCQQVQNASVNTLESEEALSGGKNSDQPKPVFSLPPALLANRSAAPAYPPLQYTRKGES